MGKVHFNGDVDFVADDEVEMAFVVVEVGLEGADIESIFEFEHSVGDTADKWNIYWSEGLIVLRNWTELLFSSRLGYIS